MVSVRKKQRRNNTTDSAQNLKRFICSIDVIRRGRNCVYVTNDSSSQYAVSSHEDPHKEGGRDEASYVVLWKITTLQYC